MEKLQIEPRVTSLLQETPGFQLPAGTDASRGLLQGVCKAAIKGPGWKSARSIIHGFSGLWCAEEEQDELSFSRGNSLEARDTNNCKHWGENKNLHDSGSFHKLKQSTNTAMKLLCHKHKKDSN